jgi:hypothetical protein
MRGEIRSGRAKLKSVTEEGVKVEIQSVRSERDGKIQQRVENVVTRVIHETQSLQKACLETTAWYEVTERDMEKIETDPGMVQSVAEHQDDPEEVSIVKQVKGRKKRHRDRKLAAGRRGESKELTRVDCESWRKLAAACRKMSRRSAVARRKWNLFRKIGTQAKCGPRKRLTAAGIKMTRHARVARLRENFVRKDWTGNQAEQ